MLDGSFLAMAGIWAFILCGAITKDRELADTWCKAASPEQLPIDAETHLGIGVAGYCITHRLCRRVLKTPSLRER